MKRNLQKRSNDFSRFLTKRLAKRLKSPLRISFLICFLLFAVILVLPASSRASAHQTAGVTLRTIIIDNYAPYTFVNAQGQPDGFSVDLMKAVAQTMGAKLEIKVDTWDNARHALESGAIDFLPMMAYSEERDVLYDFSPPHTIAFDAFFTRKDSAAINSMADLQGKTIIVMEGDQAYDYLLSLTSIKTKLIPVDSLPDALRHLASGEGDTALMPKLVGLELIKNLNLTNLEPSPVIVEAYTRPFSFAVKDGNQEILERLNQGVSIVKATGGYDKIYDKWFGALEPRRMSADTFLKYLGWIILAFVLIGAVLLLWSLLLRRQVAARTQSLEMEIQDRKQAEEALRASEARLHVIFEHANDAIHIDNADDEILDVNSRMCELLGYSREELLKMRIADLQVPEFRTNGNVILTEMKQYGNSLFEKMNIHRDGRHIPVEISVSRIESPQGDLYVSILRDITERKRAEESLRHYLSELKVLYDNGLAISTLRDPREIGRKTIETLLNNLSWHHIAIRLRRGETDDLDLIAFHQPNLDGQKIVGEEKRLNTLISKIGQGLSGWSVQIGQTIRTGNVREYPQYVDTYSGIRSGVYVPLMIGERAVGCIAVESEQENSFTEQDERLLATLAAQTAIAFENARLYQDVQWELQERLRMEEKILQLNANLEQRVEERTQELLDAQEKLVRNEKLAVLGQMAASVGHELRNPLGVMSNAIYFLKMVQSDAPAKVKEYLHLIETNIHISDKIVEDLLDFTRIKSVDREPVSIPQLVQQTLERFPPPEFVQVTLDLPADLPQAYADPHHVAQILGNLVLNACQVMQDSGELTISARAQDEMIGVAVRDNGGGISPENMKKLFEPLFTTKPKGIGLGLAVSKKLIEANGGRIEVNSELGAGSTFTLYLPIYRRAA